MSKSPWGVVCVSSREVLDVLQRLPTQSSLHIRPALLQEIIAQLQD